MGMQKLTEWFWTHRLGDRHALLVNYNVYADMANGNAQPYLTLNGWRIHTLRNKDYWINPYIPYTFKIHINDETTEYTFSSGSTVRHEERDILVLDSLTPSGDPESIEGDTIGYYYVTFSSSTHIPIPRDGELFTIHITATDKDGNTYEITEHEAAPISTTIQGPNSIVTGSVATFTLTRAMATTASFTTRASMSYYFASNRSWGGGDGFTSPYVKMQDRQLPFTEIQFLPLRNGAQPGEKNDTTYHNQDQIVSLSCAYKLPGIAPSFTDVYSYFAYGDSKGRGVREFWQQPAEHYVTIVGKNLTVVAGSSVDESLRPEFTGITYQQYYQEQLERYGGGVQGRVRYGFTAYYRSRNGGMDGKRLQYDSRFINQRRLDYTSGALLDTQKAGYTEAIGSEVFILNTPINNALYQVDGEDTLGFITTAQDYVTVLPYHSPVMPVYSARRCSPVSGGTEQETYTYDGVTYTPDDYGEYALIQWSVDFSPLNNVNEAHAKVAVPSLTSETGYEEVTLDLTDYICSGYMVVPADMEKSYDVTFTLTDDFHGTRAGRWCEDSWSVSVYDASDRRYRGFLSYPVVYVAPLNTALAMIDFRHGGTGVALGKVSELEKVFDIHRNWTLKMPYNTMVQEYNNGVAVRLYTWMQNCVSRMQAIEDQKPWGIYGERYGIGHTWFDGFTPALIPDGYGEVYTGGNYRCMMVVPNRDRVVGITHVEPFTVNRNYLNVRFDPSYSFRGQGFYNATYTPMIYLCSTRPTSIDQSTGRPNATIVDYQQITTSYIRAGSNEDGYTYWNCERGQSLNPSSGWTGFDTGILHTFNVASRRGQQLWCVVTCRQGGQSQSGYYTYDRAQLNLYDIVLSNKIANYDHY